MFCLPGSGENVCMKDLRWNHGETAWLEWVSFAASQAASKIFCGRGGPSLFIHLWPGESGAVSLSFQVSHTLEQSGSLSLLIQGRDSSQLSGSLSWLPTGLPLSRPCSVDSAPKLGIQPDPEELIQLVPVLPSRSLLSPSLFFLQPQLLPTAWVYASLLQHP